MTYRRVNNILLALIIVINMYIIVAPLLPTIGFWWENRDGTKQETLTQRVLHPDPPKKKRPNSLIVPSMLLDQPVHEGSMDKVYTVLRKGILRWPNSSTPDKGSNTVFLGHRFMYSKPKGVFYYLDKVKMGDTIGVVWDNKDYRYRVTDIREVKPTQTSILEPTKDSRLTLFTCTPLWLPEYRLVITAKLIRQAGENS